jgi:hypothetical protein
LEFAFLIRYFYLPHVPFMSSALQGQIKWTEGSIHKIEKTNSRREAVTWILHLVYMNSWDGIGGLPSGPDDPRERSGLPVRGVSNKDVAFTVRCHL